MKTLAAIQDGQTAITSLAVADGCGLSHRTVFRLVKKYRADFEEFGQLRFEISVTKRDGKYPEYAILNEDQAIYLISLFRNTAIVRRFKIELIKTLNCMISDIERSLLGQPTSMAKHHTMLPPGQAGELP